LTPRATSRLPSAPRGCSVNVPVAGRAPLLLVVGVTSATAAEARALSSALGAAAGRAAWSKASEGFWGKARLETTASLTLACRLFGTAAFTRKLQLPRAAVSGRAVLRFDRLTGNSPRCLAATSPPCRQRFIFFKKKKESRRKYFEKTGASFLKHTSAHFTCLPPFRARAAARGIVAVDLRGRRGSSAQPPGPHDLNNFSFATPPPPSSSSLSLFLPL
jgi:hypothetical protein